MAVFIFIIGLVFGSFYLVIAKRLPKGEDVLITRSHCDTCNHTLKWYNLIPVFSYIFQRGKCSFCHKKISSLNIIVELSCGTLFLIGYLLFGFSYNFFMYLIVVSLMLIIFISDFIYMIILDSPLVVAFVLIIILKFSYFGINEVLISLLSGVLLFFSMLLVQKFGELVFKKDSLGGGDIKFSFIIGLILGFKLGLVTLILSTFLALPYSVASLYISKKSEVAYGPFLAGALLIVFVFSDKFVHLLNFIFMK
ncbi:MAG: prepilin peptidase [Bacilli bacterium]